MKLFTGSLKQTLVIGFLFVVLSTGAAGLIQADPSDDFSFTIHEAEPDSYHLMSEQRVAEILADRLDLFPQSQAPRLARHLLSLCRFYRFDPAFVLAMIEVESSFRIKVVSYAGAIGLMQLMPATARIVYQANPRLKEKPVVNGDYSRILRDPYMNMELGIAYLAFLRDRYRDLSPYYLVAAYNVGPAKMDELLSRKAFKPVNTKRYYDAIRRVLPGFRSYRRDRASQA